jgi:LuxR family maltose regulon positive regulatory protein
VSLDEEDNDPRLFWAYVLTALNMQQPERFTPLLKQLQSQPPPPLKDLLIALINLLVGSEQQFLLILDDYQVITEQQVHTTLSYLVEHLPPQLRIILSTRADPPLLLSQLRAHRQVMEVRTEQLRCTVKETKAFFNEVMGIQLPDEAIQEVTTRTEGWLVGLQLLGLSLPERADPLTLLQEVSGDQRYILDYLTEEVLRRQPQDVQTFLLSTSILDRLSASLCDAVLQQTGSQQVLQWLEQANLFVVSLDSKRRWYCYHALFAEALRYRLEQAHSDLMPTLHHRASLWYAEHNQTAEAILHAFRARQWQWAADLIEQKLLQLVTLTWGASQHTLATLRQWLEQLPAEVMGSLPRLYLTCVPMLLEVASSPVLNGWLDAAEATLTASLPTQIPDAPPVMPASEERSEQENLLGIVIAFRAFLRSIEGNEEATFLLCQQALSLLSTEDFIGRMQIACSNQIAFYASSANNARSAVQNGLQSVSIAQAAGQTTVVISCMSAAALYIIGTGQLREAQRLIQQAIELETQLGQRALPEVGYPSLFQAEILREWNELDAALQLVEEGLSLCGQIEMMATLMFVFFGYAVLLRVQLSHGALDAACSTLQQIERIGITMNQPLFLYIYSFYTTVDQVRLWLARGELERATRWAEELDLRERHGTPFACEREEVACTRVLLANKQPDLALQRLEPVL